MSQYTKEEYNSEPVYYCPNCMSLNIKILDLYTDYCDNCGCTAIKISSIEEWQKLCEAKNKSINK